MATDVPPASPVGGRLQWIDAARGACVVAVVLYHICLWQFLPLGEVLWQPGFAAWMKVNIFLGSLRMPVLLAISGMLVARRISEGWSRPGAAVRAASSYYLYAVWLSIYFVVYLAFSGVDLPHRIGSIGVFVMQLFLPETPLWYIFALAVYVVVLTSVRRVPPWFVLLALAALGVVVRSTDLGWPMLWKVPENAVFFAVGVYGGRRLQHLAARRRVTDLLIATMVALGSVVLARWRLGPVADGIQDILRGLAFIVLGVAFVAQLVRWRPVAAAGEFVGRRTLQIYVLNAPLILVVLVLAHTHSDWLSGALRNPLVTTLWPIVLTVVIVMLALLVRHVLERMGLATLFDPPVTYTRWITGLHKWLSDRRHPEAAGRNVESASPANFPATGSQVDRRPPLTAPAHAPGID